MLCASAKLYCCTTVVTATKPGATRRPVEDATTAVHHRFADAQSIHGLFMYGHLPCVCQGLNQVLFLQVGEVMDDRYEVFATHGKGVFSTVLRARDQTSEGAVGEVAIKIIRANETMYKAAQTEKVRLILVPACAVTDSACVICSHDHDVQFCPS